MKSACCLVALFSALFWCALYSGSEARVSSNAKGQQQESQNTGRPWVGLKLTHLSQEDIDRLNLPTGKGALVAAIVPGGPAELAGIRQGDVVVAIEAKPIRRGDISVDVSGDIDDAKDLANRIAKIEVGSQFTLQILRVGKKLSVEMSLGAKPADSNADDDNIAMLDKEARLDAFSRRLDKTRVEAWLEKADALLFKRNLDEAESLLGRLLPLAEKTYGSENFVVSQVLDKFARLSIRQERWPEAERHLRRAAVILEKTFGPDHPEVRKVIRDVAWLCFHQGRAADAESLLRRVLAMAERAHGPDHPAVGKALQELAWLKFYKDDVEEGKSLFNKALAFAKKAREPYKPSATSAGRNSLTIITDVSNGRTVETSCSSIIETLSNGAAIRTCAGSGLSEFEVLLEGGTQVWCDGREFSVHGGGGLKGCNLSRPLIVVNSQGIERCRGAIEVTEGGELAECIAIDR